MFRRKSGSPFAQASIRSAERVVQGQGACNDVSSFSILHLGSSDHIAFTAKYKISRDLWTVRRGCLAFVVIRC